MWAGNRLKRRVFDGNWGGTVSLVRDTGKTEAGDGAISRGSPFQRWEDVGAERLSSKRRFVEDHPVKAEVLDSIHENLELDRLSDVAVAAQVVAFHLVLLLHRRGQDDNRQEFRRLGLSDSLEDLQPIHFWKAEIKKDNRGKHLGFAVSMLSFGEEVVQGFGAVLGNDDLVSEVVATHGPKGQGYIVRVVFNEKNRGRAHDGLHWYPAKPPLVVFGKRRSQTDSGSIMKALCRSRQDTRAGGGSDNPEKVAGLGEKGAA